jgi:hypothetical protein
MNKENAKEFLPLVQALADGLAIEFNDGGDWVNVVNLNTDSYDPDEYRIKPEPRTFQMWLASSGVMYPEKLFDNGKPYELITVQEVLK